MDRTRLHRTLLLLGSVGIIVLAARPVGARPTDPGVRETPSDNAASAALSGLTQYEMRFSCEGLARFNFIELVNGGSPRRAQGTGSDRVSTLAPAAPVTVIPVRAAAARRTTL